MGNFLSKNKNTKEQLEDIQNEIDKIEELKITTFVREKNYYALFIIVSLISYIFGVVYLYVTYDRKQILRTSSAYAFWILFPVLAFYTRKLIGIYFKWVRESNNLNLMTLMKLKKKLISKVQDTATFNEAKEILTKYDPSALRNLGMTFSSNVSSPPARVPILSPMRPSGSPQYNNTPNPKMNANSSAPPTRTPFALMPPPSLSRQIPSTQQRTIKPILPQHRSVVEKLVDYVFNDGPSNRFALICTQCYSHNGMALPDEFEYISFLCAYCTTFNPARKSRPPPPNLVQRLAIGPGEGPKVELAEDEPKDDGVKIAEVTLDTTLIHAADSSIGDKKDIPFIDQDDKSGQENEAASGSGDGEKTAISHENVEEELESKENEAPIVAEVEE